MSLEHCIVCGEATGNAGPGDGSVYCVSCEIGPLCRHCSVFGDDSWCVDCAGYKIESLTAEVGKWRRQDAMHMGELRDLHKQLAEKDKRIEELEEAFRPVLDAFCDTSWNETTGLHQGVVHVTTLNIARRALEETEVK